jgi:hypothetical protein
VTASRKKVDTEDECEVAMERLRESIERFEADEQATIRDAGRQFYSINRDLRVATYPIPR